MRRAVLVFLFSLILVVSRRPDVLFHAQFWAEDGKFFADAYNLGAVTALFHPAAGYFVTLPRLAALLAQFIPLAAAPLLFNVIAILIHILPVQFLLSSRCRKLGSEAGRCLFAFLYLALPNSTEMQGNITNAQWRLAFLALLVLFAEPGRTALWNAFDWSVMAGCALTGPFIIFIAPIAAVFSFNIRDRWRSWLLVTSGIGAAIQVATVLVAGNSERPTGALRAATPELFVQIMAKQVFLAALVGRRTLAGFSFNSRMGLATAALAALIGVAIELYVLIRGPVRWRAFILFSGCILAVSLAYPMTPSPQWPILLAAGGVRYWFFPMLAFLVSLIWMLHRRNPAPVKGVAIVLLVVMVFGVIQDWGHPRPVDLHFPAYAKTFSELPAGASFVIPINPVGKKMELIKH